MTFEGDIISFPISLVGNHIATAHRNRAEIGKFVRCSYSRFYAVPLKQGLKEITATFLGDVIASRILQAGYNNQAIALPSETHSYHSYYEIKNNVDGLHLVLDSFELKANQTFGSKHLVLFHIQDCQVYFTTHSSFDFIREDRY